MVLKAATVVFFILISASFLPPHHAGGRLKFMNELAADHKEASEKVSSELSYHCGRNSVHPKVHTSDYDSYDPAPAMEKPPFKLIPNR